MASEKGSFVLRDVGAGAGAEDSDFCLYVLDVVLARLEINLERSGQDNLLGQAALGQRVLTSLMATMSPVAFSMPLYTTPKLPPVCLLSATVAQIGDRSHSRPSSSKTW